MTRVHSFLGLTMALSGFWLLGASHALAMDIDGAWATDKSSCAKIFSKQSDGIVFSKESDMYGAGFIVDGNRLIGKQARCRIKTRKENAAAIHLLATCSDDIVLSDMQMSLKVISQNTLARIFPEIGDMEVSYDRCTF